MVFFTHVKYLLFGKCFLYVLNLLEKLIMIPSLKRNLALRIASVLATIGLSVVSLEAVSKPVTLTVSPFYGGSGDAPKAQIEFYAKVGKGETGQNALQGAVVVEEEKLDIEFLLAQEKEGGEEEGFIHVPDGVILFLPPMETNALAGKKKSEDYPYLVGQTIYILIPHPRFKKKNNVEGKNDVLNPLCVLVKKQAYVNNQIVLTVEGEAEIGGELEHFNGMVSIDVKNGHITDANLDIDNGENIFFKVPDINAEHDPTPDVSDDYAADKKPAKGEMTDEKAEPVTGEQPKEPVTNEPPREPEADEKPQETLSDERPQEPVADEPPKEAEVDEKAQEPVADEPPKEAEVDEKAQEPVADEPPKEAEVDEKAQEPVADEPPKEAEVDEKAQEPVADEPPKEAEVDEKAQEPVADEPPKEAEVDEKAQEPEAGEKPQETLLDGRSQEPEPDEKLQETLSDGRSQEPEVDEKPQGAASDESMSDFDQESEKDEAESDSKPEPVKEGEPELDSVPDLVGPVEGETELDSEPKPVKDESDSEPEPLEVSGHHDGQLDAGGENEPPNQADLVGDSQGTGLEVIGNGTRFVRGGSSFSGASHE